MGRVGGVQALPYNSFVLAGPDGTAHRYRKLNPFTHGGERERFRAGTDPVTVQIGDLRVTPFICYDLRFADVFWQAGPGTDVFLVPANWPAARRNHWRTLLEARAIENQAYVVGCNRVGTGGDGIEHAGDSRIVSPMGELLATAAGVETIVARRCRRSRGARHPRPPEVPGRPPELTAQPTAASDRAWGPHADGSYRNELVWVSSV